MQRIKVKHAVWVWLPCMPAPDRAALHACLPKELFGRCEDEALGAIDWAFCLDDAVHYDPVLQTKGGGEAREVGEGRVDNIRHSLRKAEDGRMSASLKIESRRL